MKVSMNTLAMFAFAMMVCLSPSNSFAKTGSDDPTSPGATNSPASVDFLIKHTRGEFTLLLGAVAKGDVPEWPFCILSSYAMPIAAADRLEQDLLRGLYYRVLRQFEHFQPTLQKLPPKKFHKRITQLIQLRDHIAKRRSYSNQVLINALNAVMFVELTKQMVLRRDVSKEMHEHINRLRALKTDPADILAYLNAEVGETHTVEDLYRAARRDLTGRGFESTVEAGYVDSERLRRIGYWVEKGGWGKRTDSLADQVVMFQLGFVPNLAVRNIGSQLEAIKDRDTNNHISLPTLAMYIERSRGRIDPNSSKIGEVLSLSQEDRESLGSNISPLFRTHSVTYDVSNMIKHVANGFIHFRALFDADPNTPAIDTMSF